MKLSNLKNISLLGFLLIVLLIQPAYSEEEIRKRTFHDQNILFVEISTDWCFACKLLEPTVQQLAIEYGGKVEFLKLNPTSEESLFGSQQLAYEYDILDFFNENRNVFPRVAVFCPGATKPIENITGAHKIEVYREKLNNLLGDTEKICSLNGRPPDGGSDDDRPTEAVIGEIMGDRPPVPNFTDRPFEPTGPGRPQELSFWTIGTPVPLYAYYQLLLLPKCGSEADVVCHNYNNNLNNPSKKGKNGKDDEPEFKPYDPNATRDEKGLHL